MTGVGERKAASVAQHVRVSLESKPASAPARSIILAKPAVENGEPRSLVNTNDDVGLSRCSLRRARISSPRRRPLLRPPNVQHSRLEVDLRPFKVHKLARAQPMAVGQQDHCRVPGAPGRRHERFHSGVTELTTDHGVGTQRACAHRRCPFRARYPGRL
jgi:hypothetical protein